MAKKSSKSRHNSAPEKTGSSCGFFLGCLVIIAAAAAVIFFLFIKPELEDAGYSFEGLKDKVLGLKEKAEDSISQGKEIYQDGKDKYEDVKDKAEEAVDKGRDVYQDAEEKIEDIKEKTAKPAGHFQALPPAQKKTNQASPKLIEDD